MSSENPTILVNNRFLFPNADVKSLVFGWENILPINVEGLHENFDLIQGGVCFSPFQARYKIDGQSCRFT